LTAAEMKGCYDIPYRAYALRDDFINGLGYLAAANVGDHTWDLRATLIMYGRR